MANLDPAYGKGSGVGGLTVPSDQIFDNVALRDTYFTDNPDKLKEGSQCIVLTSPPSGLYQVYNSGAWVDHSAVVVGKTGSKGDKGDTGETVKINAVENAITGNTLATTVSLDDGTSATSEPVELPKGGVIFDNVTVPAIEVVNGIEGGITDDGNLLLAVTMSNSAWYEIDVPISETPYEIKTDEQLGIDYEFTASPSAQSMQLFQEGLAEGSQVKVSVNGYTSTDKPILVFQETDSGTVSWYITTPTVFMLHKTFWRVEESSQLVHIENSTVLGGNASKQIVVGVAVDPTSDITMAVNSEGVLVVGRTYTPPTDKVDVAFWWSDNAAPNSSDIILALGQPQTAGLISKAVDVSSNELQSRSFTAKRGEGSFRFAYFAWPANFFVPEPTKVYTGFGAASSWVTSNVTVSGVPYKVLTVEITNNSQSLEDYALVQEGRL